MIQKTLRTHFRHHKGFQPGSIKNNIFPLNYKVPTPFSLLFQIYSQKLNTVMEIWIRTPSLYIICIFYRDFHKRYKLTTACCSYPSTYFSQPPSLFPSRTLATLFVNCHIPLDLCTHISKYIHFLRPLSLEYSRSQLFTKRLRNFFHLPKNIYLISTETFDDYFLKIKQALLYRVAILLK